MSGKENETKLNNVGTHQTKHASDSCVQERLYKRLIEAAFRYILFHVALVRQFYVKSSSNPM